MYKSVFLVLIILLGCTALGAAPALYTPGLTPIQEAQPFHEVPTKLHEVIITGSRGTTTQFLVKPNDFQVCACTVNGDFIACACIQPEFGLCAERAL